MSRLSWLRWNWEFDCFLCLQWENNREWKWKGIRKSENGWKSKDVSQRRKYCQEQQNARSWGEPLLFLSWMLTEHWEKERDVHDNVINVRWNYSSTQLCDFINGNKICLNVTSNKYAFKGKNVRQSPDLRFMVNYKLSTNKKKDNTMKSDSNWLLLIWHQLRTCKIYWTELKQV